MTEELHPTLTYSEVSIQPLFNRGFFGLLLFHCERLSQYNQ